MLLEDLVKSLLFFEVATVVMSEETIVFISSVLPVIHGLITQLASTDNDSSIIQQFKDIVRSALKSRWLIDTSPTQVPVLAAALDPRIHSLKFLNSSDRIATRDAIIE